MKTLANLFHAVFALRTLVAALVMLAACTNNAPPENNLEGTAGFAPQLRDQPTATPPPWVEGAETVTLDNAPRITYLGRLDANTVPSTVFAHALSPDATRLAGLNNDQLIVWDLITGQIVFNTARDEASYVFYGSEKTEIYTLDENGQLAIYDAATGKIKDNLLAHPQYNGTAAYNPDTGWLTLGGLDGQVKVWDTTARQSMVTFAAGTRAITALALSPDGERLATANEDGTIQIWDWRNKTPTAEFQDATSQIAFSPDGTRLAVGTESKIDIWGLSESQLAYSLATGPGATSDVLTYSPEGEFLLNGGFIPAITVWDTATGRLINTLPGVGGDRTSAEFSPDGSLLATSVLGGAVSLWDVSKLRETTLNQATLAVGTRQIIEVDWSSDGYLLLLFDATGPIQVWGIPPQPAEATVEG